MDRFESGNTLRHYKSLGCKGNKGWLGSKGFRKGVKTWSGFKESAQFSEMIKKVSSNSNKTRFILEIEGKAY